MNRPRLHRSAALAITLAGAIAFLAGVAGAVARDENPKRLVDPAALDAGEERPGGAATSQESVDNRDAFSHFSHGLDRERELKFKVGNAIFRRLWVAAPSSTESADGLGPLYNARACQTCHLKNGRGRPPQANFPNEDAVSMVLRLSVPPETAEQKQLIASHRSNVIPDPVYGEQLQNLAVPSLDGEGHMHIEYEEIPVKLEGGEVASIRKPAYSVTDLGYGPMHPQVMLSPRIAPPMIGLGLIEAIPEADIRANADPDDANKDGISGRANEVWSIDEKKVTLGRFGWKAGTPSVRQQSAVAAADDIGLSNALVPIATGDCTPAEARCMTAPNGNSERSDGHEIGDDLMDLVTFYSENLAVPARRNPHDPEVLIGKALFYASGCAACHHPSFTTGTATDQPYLSQQLIWPYSDFLLHDMGDGLADDRPEGVANGREWRTAPLWSVGLTRVVNNHTFFLHDGRARTIEEAILWHGGEARAARDTYTKLTKNEREALRAFVNSL